VIREPGANCDNHQGNEELREGAESWPHVGGPGEVMVRQFNDATPRIGLLVTA